MTQPNTPSTPDHSLARKIVTAAAIGAAGLGANYATPHGDHSVERAALPTTPGLVATPHIVSPILEVPSARHKLANKHVVTRHELQPFMAKPKPPTAAAQKPAVKEHQHVQAKLELGGEYSTGSNLLIPVPETPLQPAPTLENLHPEQLSVPAEVSAYMHDNVTYNYATGCSGLLIRDPAGRPIGEQTAQHCGLLAKDGHLSTGPDGQPRASFDRAFTVATGDRLDQMTFVGQVNKVLVSAETDNSKDIVIGAFGDTDPSVVAANANRASDQEIAALQKGDVIYSSGWPVDQPHAKATDGILQRQEFALHVLGDVEWSIANTGQTIKMKLAAVPKNADGTKCSPGDSGAGVIRPEADGTMEILGNQTAYFDFETDADTDPANAEAEKRYIEDLFGVDMSGYSAVCAISYQEPDIDQGAYVANVINSTVTINEPPRNPDAQADLQLAYQEFADPTYHRQILDGTLRILSGKDGLDIYVDQPVLFYNPADNSVVVGYSNDQAGGQLQTVFYGDPGLLTAFANRTDGTMPVEDSVGAVSFGPDTADDFGAYTDPNGLKFGMQLANPPLKLGQQFTVRVDKGGNIVTEPVTQQPATGGPKG